MARKRKQPKELTDGQRRRVRSLVAIGLRPPEIAESLGVEVEAVESFAGDERRHIAGGNSAHEWQQLMVRALQLELQEAMRCRDKYHLLLPDEISRNGQQPAHLAHYGRYLEACEHVARIHDRLARAVDQLAKSDGSYREGGATDYLPPVINISIRDEPGDVPVRSDERVSEDDE